MENNEVNAIPYIAYESSMARMERVNKKLWIALLVLIVALVGSNVGWIVYENQYEDVVVTQEVEASSDGESDLNLNTIGGDYNVSESESKTNGQD